MDTKMNALFKNKTWSLVSYHPTMNLVGWKWVFKLKHKPDGSIDGYKARLVAKDFYQLSGLDYGEIFNPDIKSTTIVPCAVCSSPRDGLFDSWMWIMYFCRVFFLRWSTWNNLWGSSMSVVPIMYASFTAVSMTSNMLHEPDSHLSSYLVIMGFVGSKSDTSLFLRRLGTDLLLVLIYVDDIIITGNNSRSVTRLIQELGREFSLKIFSPLHYFSGMEYHRTPSGLFLSQQKYICDLLLWLKMEGVKPVSSPMATSCKLSKAVDKSLFDPFVYRSTIGVLDT